MKKKEIIVNRIDSDQQAPTRRRRGSQPVGKTAKQRRKEPKKPMNPKKKRIMVICIIVSVLLILGISAWGVSNLLNSNIGGETDPNIQVDDIVEDKVSVLLVGSDGGGYNTDTLMLVMMDCKTQKLSILSIPRDTRIPNPYGGSGYSKINSVYAAKGMDGLIRQVGEVTGLPINYYVMVDFAGFREAIDVLGGVEFDVPMRLKYDDPAQNLHIDLQPGLQRLDGDKAEQLVRSRNQYAMADIDRTKVQREFLKATITQHATPANLLKINDLYGLLTKYVKTNITLGDAIKYAPSLTKVNSEEIQMFILPGVTNNYGDWLYNAEEMEQLANEFFWYNVTVRPTPRPSVKPNSGGNNAPTTTSTPKKTATPTPDRDDDDEDNPPTKQPTKQPTATPTKQPTEAPTKAPTATPTKKPTEAPTKAPTKEPTPPPVTEQPGEYPDGI